MTTRTKILISAAATLVAAIALFAQASDRPQQTPMAQILSQNPGFADGGLGRHHRFRDRFGHGIGRFLIAEYLELTDEQKAVIQNAKEAAREDLRDDVMALRDGHQAIRAAVRNGQPVDALADQQGDRVASLIKEVAEMLTETKVKLHLTPEQEAKIEKIHERVQERMDVFWRQLAETAPAEP